MDDMTNTSATSASASDRYEAARRVLADYGDTTATPDDPGAVAQLTLALRSLIQPPPVNNHPDDLADAWAARLHERGTIEVLGMNGAIASSAAYREAYLQGIRAGIQAAHESWEPETAPTIDDNADLIEDLRQIRDQRGDWRGVLDSLIGDDE